MTQEVNQMEGTPLSTPWGMLGESPQKIGRSTELWCLSGIILVAAVLRLSVIGADTRIIPTDGLSFVEIAKNIANNFNFYHSMFTPGYPMWVALFQKTTGMSWGVAGQWTSFTFSMLLFAPLYSIFRRSVFIPAALLGLLFYACLPLWVEFGTETQTMSVGSFWLFLSCALCMRVIEKRENQIILLLCAGVFLGLAALTRPELLVAIFVFPLWIAYRSRNIWLVSPWLILLMSLTVYSPYVLMLHEHTGQWKLTMKSEITQRNAMAVGQQNFHATREKNLQASSESFSSGLLTFWFSDPVATFKRVAVNGYLIHEYMWPQQFPVVLSFFLALGLIVSKSKNMDVLVVVSLVYLPSMAFLLDARIMLPWATPFLAWAGAGAWLVLNWRQKIGLAIVACAVLLMVGSALHIVRQNNEDIAARHAGQWLSSNFLNKDSLVWSRKPWVAYYAGLQHHPLPKDAEFNLFVQPMKAGDWLIVDTRHFSIARPKVFMQMFAGNVPHGITLIHQFKGPNGHILNLYRLKFNGTNASL